MERVYAQGELLAKDLQYYLVPGRFVAIWFLGQASVAIRNLGTLILIDPYLSESRGRTYPPPLTPDQLPKVDWVFCTHNHLDHLDVATLAPLAARFPECRFVVPAPHVEATVAGGVPHDRVIGARAHEPLQYHPLRVTPLRAKHEAFDVTPSGEYPYLGYVIEVDGLCLFHAGDTVGYDGQAEELARFRPHVAFLPINGRDWARNRRHIAGNMNYREALDLAQAAHVDLVVPIHYDLFNGNTENPAFFVDHLYRTAPAQKFKLFAVGERIVYGG